MNFTPFYIATDSLTEEQAYEVTRKSVEAGAHRRGVPIGYPGSRGDFYRDRGYYRYIGVDYCNDAIVCNKPTNYGRNAIQITYDQLDAHLGWAQESPTNTEEPSPESLAGKLRNTKIDLRKEDGTVDEELSRAFQEAVFECGGKWLSRQVIARYLEKEFLYIDEDLAITHTDKTDIGFFQGHPYTQIEFTYQRKLEWDVTEVPTTRPKARETIELNGITYDKAEFEAVMRYLTPIEVS